jgi:hypothetical protein
MAVTAGAKNDFSTTMHKSKAGVKKFLVFLFLEKANCASERISQFVMSQDFAVDVKQLIADRDAGKRSQKAWRADSATRISGSGAH